MQTFVTKKDGSFILTKIGEPTNYIESGIINHLTGEISTVWKVIPPSDKTKLIINYEYNMEF